jgi:hypothetical protein
MAKFYHEYKRESNVWYELMSTTQHIYSYAWRISNNKTSLKRKEGKKKKISLSLLYSPYICPRLLNAGISEKKIWIFEVIGERKSMLINRRKAFFSYIANKLQEKSSRWLIEKKHKNKIIDDSKVIHVWNHIPGR